MITLSSWIAQHILRGGWDVDLSQTPPTREELKVYQRRARWRRGVAILTLVLILGQLDKQVYTPIADYLIQNSQGLAGGALLVVGSLVLMAPVMWSAWIILLLAEDKSFRTVERAEAAYRHWKEAQQVLPEVLCYQQWLLVNRSEGPVRAEVEAAWKLIASQRATIDEDLHPNAGNPQ